MKKLTFTFLLLFGFLLNLNAQSNYNLHFNGQDYVTVSGFGLSGFTAMTIEAWIYLDDYSHNQYAGSAILTKEWTSCAAPWYVVHFAVNSDNFASAPRKLSFGVNLGGGNYASATGSTDITLNAWHHVVGTWDGTNVTIYLDGVQDGTGSGTGTVQDAATQVHIGERLTCGSFEEWVEGNIDDVRFWSTGRTQTQVLANMYTELTGTEPGLYAYWKFDEGIGQVAGDSGANGFNGMLGSTTGVDGNDPAWTISTSPVIPLGDKNALDFDGTNDYVSIADQPQLRPGNGSWSVEVWVKAPNINQAGAIVSKDQNIAPYEQFSVFINGPSSHFYMPGKRIGLVFRQNDSYERGCYTNNDIIDGNWHHIACVADKAKDEIKIYVDGIDQQITLDYVAGSWPTINNPDPLRIGSDNQNNPLQCTVDEVRIYNRPLTQAEIVCLMNLELQNPALLTDLVAYYQFNQNSGTALYDHTQFAHHGTLNNMDPATDWIKSTAMTQNTLSFDGSNDYVNVPGDASLDVTTSYTIETWFYRNSLTSSYKPIVDRGPVGLSSEIEIYTQWASNNYQLTVVHNRGGSFDYAYWPTVPANQWIHISVRYTGGIVNVFYNGIYQAPVSGDENFPAIASGLNDLNLGFHGGGPFYHQGYLDELRVWNIARTENEIRENMYKELETPGSEASLVAYYQFDEISGTVLPDHSANTNNGTLMNMDPSTDWVSSTAPIPYQTLQDGSWNNNTTWLAGQQAPVNAWARIQNDHTLSVNINAETESTCNCGQMNVSPGINYTVNDILLNNSGSGGFVLNGNNSGSASLLHISDDVEGSFERYNSANVWHFVSPPISDGIAQIFHGKYLQAFDEPTNSYSDIIPDPTPINAMEGYALYSFNNWISYYAGTFNNGAIGNINNLSRGGSGFNFGWNLTGNPYPSAIDWNAGSGWTKTNVNATIYIENNGNWATWNGVTGTNGGSQYIAAGQGFFVEVADGQSQGTLMLDNDVRLHNSVAFFKNSIDNMLRLTASGNGKTDETVIIFNEDASNEYVGESDAHKLFASDDLYPQLYSIDNDGMAINVLPEADRIPLGFQCGQSGQFSILLNENTLLTDKNVYLEDSKSGMMHSISDDPEYTFEYKSGEDTDRFILHFMDPGSDIIIYAFADKAYVILPETNNGIVAVYNIAGQLINSQEASPGLSTIQIEKAGYYVVKVTTDHMTETRKVVIR